MRASRVLRAAAALIIGGACLAGAGCGGRGPSGGKMPKKTAAYEVFKGDRKVCVFRDRPGKLTSTAMLPPGGSFPDHPFLSADAFDPLEEDALRRHLEASNSFDDFAARLRKAGYTLRPSAD